MANAHLAGGVYPATAQVADAKHTPGVLLNS